MEQKKTLWIIAAVGVFLLVVLGVPAILHYPSRNPVPAYASISPVEKKSASNGWTKTTSDISAPVSVTEQDFQAAKVNDLVVLADNATVYSQNTTSNDATTIDLNSLKNEVLTEAQAPSQPQNINITVNIPETSASEAKEVVETPAITASPAVKSVQKAETKPKAKVAKTAPAPAATTKTAAQQKQNLRKHSIGYRLQHTAIKKVQKVPALFLMKTRFLQTSLPTEITKINSTTEFA